MNVALTLAFLFYIGSTFGWILEVFYRRFNSKKWINPGFLTGPYLPIYGIGLCTLFLLSLIDMSFVQNPILQVVLVVIFMALVMTAIEYIAGIIFIKGLKVKLWDYSNQWGNIDGIVCPLYTFFWSLLSAIYYFFIQSRMIEAINWLFDNLAFSFVIGFFFGLLTIDVAHSMNLVVKLKKFAKENNILIKFEELKNSIREDQEKRKEKSYFMFAFRTTQSLGDILNEYKNKYENIKKELMGKRKKEGATPMKSQKGITLMLLVTTIIMMALIFGSISYYSISAYRLRSYYSMCSDIELLDEKIALYYLENKTLPVTSDYILVSELVSDYEEGNSNYNPNNSGNLYKIDLSKLDNLSLQKTEYYIDEQSHTIYTTTGQTIGDEVLYTVPLDYQTVNLSLYQ